MCRNHRERLQFWFPPEGKTEVKVSRMKVLPPFAGDVGGDQPKGGLELAFSNDFAQFKRNMNTWAHKSMMSAA